MTDGTVFELADEAAMDAFGRRLAGVLRPGLVVSLEGPLGAGKTTLVRGVLRGLGHRGVVRSPTYALVESYVLGAWRISHFDLYRLADPEELELIGLRDFLDEGAVLFVEWPERGRGVLPTADLTITIAYDGRGRRLAIEAGSRPGGEIAARLPGERVTGSPPSGDSV